MEYQKTKILESIKFNAEKLSRFIENDTKMFLSIFLEHSIESDEMLLKIYTFLERSTVPLIIHVKRFVGHRSTNSHIEEFLKKSDKIPNVVACITTGNSVLPPGSKFRTYDFFEKFDKFLVQDIQTNSWFFEIMSKTDLIRGRKVQSLSLRNNLQFPIIYRRINDNLSYLEKEGHVLHQNSLQHIEFIDLLQYFNETYKHFLSDNVISKYFKKQSEIMEKINNCNFFPKLKKFLNNDEDNGLRTAREIYNDYPWAPFIPVTTSSEIAQKVIRAREDVTGSELAADIILYE